MTAPIIHATEECAYFLDLDGTLLHLEETPSLVVPSRAVSTLVETLYRSSDGAVALITGRALADVDRLFPDRRLPAAGQHGLERRAANGVVSRHAGPVRPLNQARRMLADIVARHPRLLLEDKGLSLALHYRRAPRLASFATRAMHSIQSALGDQYCLHRGKRVVELVPAGRNKGLAIAAFMREAPFRDRVPVFIGDDVTDEHGFAVVERLHGYGVKVGPGPTMAKWRLSDVRAVRAWLEGRRPMLQRSTSPRF